MRREASPKAPVDFSFGGFNFKHGFGNVKVSCENHVVDLSLPQMKRVYHWFGNAIRYRQQTKFQRSPESIALALESRRKAINLRRRVLRERKRQQQKQGEQL